MSETTYDRLVAVREDIGWRIAWAAKNGDSERCGEFVALLDAIDKVLARHDGHIAGDTEEGER